MWPRKQQQVNRLNYPKTGDSSGFLRGFFGFTYS